ncbi:hypothetical protein HELRODRAFT_160964 [Helobdella robusta]|uniref:Uncharacterized protein n=1 Tax=Helobdella robusta TaxID=6412 RepID=T1EQX4_HELRO|nr:hypothetical protein HELRODRAFT_160964 [Helobdella robusta]ESO01797.1 hypothetical protein HELRODRAFT_160964 [Helobdella robusta]
MVETDTIDSKCLKQSIAKLKRTESGKSISKMITESGAERQMRVELNETTKQERTTGHSCKMEHARLQTSSSPSQTEYCMADITTPNLSFIHAYLFNVAAKIIRPSLHLSLLFQFSSS